MCMYVITRNIHKMIDCYNFINDNITEFKSSEVLCAFDIDNTITVIECKYSYWPNICKWRAEFDNIKNKYSDVDSNMVFTNLLFEYPQRVIDNDVYKLTDDLECRKIMITASLTGSYKNIDALEEYRYNVLANFNITFENEFNIANKLVFDNFKPNFGNYQSYYRGILFTNGVTIGEDGVGDKGKLLRSFLQKVNFNPKCIVLIDDNPENHQAISKEFSKDVDKIINIIYDGTDYYCPIEVGREDFINFWDRLFNRIQNDPIKN